MSTENGVEGLSFPCQIDVKVFMKSGQENTTLLQGLILEEISREQLLFIKTRKSSAGRYQSLSCRVNAQSRAQIDSVFIRLTSHPDVLMVI